MNRALTAAFGLVMVLTAGADGSTVTLAILAAALAAVVAGLTDRRVGMLAVLLCVAALAMADPTPYFAAVSGLAATTYLLSIHADRAGVGTLTVPAMAGMIGFTLVGLVATAVRTDVGWMPLVAPAVMAAVVIVVALPLLSGGVTGSARPPGDNEPAG